LLKGKKEVLVRGIEIFNKTYSLIEHYVINKDNNITIIGFFYCTHYNFKNLIYIDANSYYSANGPKDIGTLNLIIY